MGYHAVHAACADGDDQELRRCIEGLDVDRDGLFDRHDPHPRVVVGRAPGTHGRFNTPTPAAVRGSLGDTPLHKAAMAGQTVALGYLLSAAASGGLKVPVDGGLGLGLDGDEEYRAKVLGVAPADQHGVGGAAGEGPGGGPGEAPGAPASEEPMQVLARLVHTRNDAGQTALHLAALHGNYTCVQMLLAAKSDVQATDSTTGYTPLHAAVRMDHMRVVMLLLDAQADPNAPDRQGSSPLHTAARYGIYAAVRLLAGSGSMLDGQRVQDHYTPLHLACRYNVTTDTAIALLEARADPTMLSRAGQPPALIAATLGDEAVLEVVSEAHWRMCLENPDGEGLTRIRGGGNLTARAIFDKAMQRQCWELSLPDDRGKWYDVTYEFVHSWASEEDSELSMQIPADQPGVPCGRWVAPGPLTEEALDKAVSHSFGEALELLKDKISSFTPLEKIQELLTVELSAPARMLRTANEHWWDGRRARENFDFAVAEAAFKTAAKTFASDWWGSDGVESATSLALEMRALKELKENLDEKMEAGDRLRKRFDFKEAAQQYQGVGEQFASYGHMQRAFEAYCRLQEVEAKTLQRQEAEECVRLAKDECVTSTPLAEYPHSRLMLVEAVAHFKRACKLYKGYKDAQSYKNTKSRFTAAQWNLEKQGKAYEHLKKGNTCMSWVALGADYERRADTHTVYVPTEAYTLSSHEPKVLMLLQIAEAVAEFKSAIIYLADIGDQQVHAIAAANLAEAERLLALQKDAHEHMQQGQAVEVRMAVDTSLQGHLLVFGQTPSQQDAESLCIAGRQPYRRHMVEHDYPYKDPELGTIYHRKMLTEGMAAFRHAKDCFAAISDEENRREAQRQELRLVECIRVQSEGTRLLKEAHRCVLTRQYADAAEKFKHASQRMAEIEDPGNAEYIQALSDDAGEKRRIADLAHQKMREGQRLLELREEFERWEDVVDVGLPSFTDAEVLFRDAGELFDDLDHEDNKLQATDRMTESFERKTHAQELRDSFVVVVQPTGDFAPQRRDAKRRTMGYATAEHAINDTAASGFSSTYHTRSEILEGSTIYLRKGEHQVSQTLEAKRNVTIRAEDGVVADDCKVVIKETSLLLSHASSVKVCVCVCVCARARARALVLTCPGPRAYMLTWRPRRSSILARMHAHMYARMRACMHTCMHTYAHACV